MCVVIKNKLLSDLPLGASGRILEVEITVDWIMIIRELSPIISFGFFTRSRDYCYKHCSNCSGPILVKLSQGYIALTRSEAALVVVDEV